MSEKEAGQGLVRRTKASVVARDRSGIRRRVCRLSRSR